MSASAGRAAGSVSRPLGTPRRRSMLLAGDRAMEAARSGLSSRYEQRGDDSSTTSKVQHGTLHSYDSMESHGIGLGTDEGDPLLESRGRSGIEGEDDEAVALPRRCARAAVFPLLQRVRDDVRSTIDTHLEWHELTALDINYAVVRPLALKYSKLGKGEEAEPTDNLSVLFVFLVNRLQFQRDAERDLALQGINTTRAALCELLAMKLLRTFARTPVELITALTFPFSPFQGASEETLEREGLLEAKRQGEEDYGTDITHFASPAAEEESGNRAHNSNPGQDRRRGGRACNPVFGPGQCSSALELAVLTKAKKFIKTPLCQRCVAGIYEGRIVLSYQSAHAIVDDSYKKRPLGIYDPVKAPFLDHHRLRVPLIRSRIEFFNFCILLLLYVWCLGQRREEHWTLPESLFTIWAASFLLGEVSQMLEHGLVMYVSSLYDILDLLFCTISFIWLGLRATALLRGDMKQSAVSFDTLSLGAILLCPRAASTLVQDNVILLALKAMLAEFSFFMLLAMVCFSGFVYTFWQLSSADWSVGRIVWLMTKISLGNSFIAFDTAQEFSKTYGPFLMVFFAVMANTLLLTILISLLSNTFSLVAQNAVEEAMYQFACKTVSGISSEALLSYQMMPLNLVALFVLGPASLVLTPRYLHKANVYLLRATSWPILLIIRFGTYYWPGLLSRKRSRSIGVGNSSAHIGHSANVTASGQSLTANVLTLPGSESSHYLSWLPLPRSRATPERDIFEAAFTRAKSEAKAAKARSTLADPRVQDDDIEDMFAQQNSKHSFDGPRGLTPATPRGAAHLPPDDEDEMQDSLMPRAGRYAESPLARLFGRALGHAPGRKGRTSSPAGGDMRKQAIQQQKQQHNSENAQDLHLDDDAIRAGETATTAAQGQGEDELNQGESNDDDDDGSGRGTELRQEQASTSSLVRSLASRFEAYEQRQQRIERLLARLVEAGESS